jgi:hypothetical protein
METNEDRVIRLRLAHSLSQSEDVVSAVEQLGALLFDRPEFREWVARIEKAKDEAPDVKVFQRVVVESIGQLAEMLIRWQMPSIRLLFELTRRHHSALEGSEHHWAPMQLFIARETREALRPQLQPLFDDLTAWSEREEPVDAYHAGLLERSVRVVDAVKRHIAGTPRGSLKRTPVYRKVIALYRARVERVPIAELGDELDEHHPDGDGRRQIREWFDYLDRILMIDPPSLNVETIADLRTRTMTALGE